MGYIAYKKEMENYTVLCEFFFVLTTQAEKE